MERKKSPHRVARSFSLTHSVELSEVPGPHLRTLDSLWWRKYFRGSFSSCRLRSLYIAALKPHSAKVSKKKSVHKYCENIASLLFRTLPASAWWVQLVGTSAASAYVFLSFLSLSLMCLSMWLYFSRLLNIIYACEVVVPFRTKVFHRHLR